MATGQTILNLMEVLHPELQLQTGEADVTKGLLAANAAQDYMESVFALQPDLLGDQTGTLTAASGVERTPFPATVLRVDKLQYLDSSSLLPVYDLRDIKRTGGHAVSNVFYPYISTASAVTGVPVGYYTDGRYVYWTPVPDGDYLVRWYGFLPAVDLTATGTMAYPDICQLPMATMAVRIIRTGLDDPVDAYLKLAADTFEPVVNALSNFQRERAPGMNYRFSHDT